MLVHKTPRNHRELCACNLYGVVESFVADSQLRINRGNYRDYCELVAVSRLKLVNGGWLCIIVDRVHDVVRAVRHRRPATTVEKFEKVYKVVGFLEDFYPLPSE